MIPKLPTKRASYQWRGICFGVAGLLAASLMGCGAITDASSTSVTEIAMSDFSNSPTPCVFDAGIIFTDEASYLCVPLSRLGIADSDEVLSLKSSCDCIRPSIIRYLAGQGMVKKAVRLNVAFESYAGKRVRPVSLGVQITLRLEDDEERTLTVNFLQTQPAS